MEKQKCIKLHTKELCTTIIISYRVMDGEATKKGNKKWKQIFGSKPRVNRQRCEDTAKRLGYDSI